jgi:hypothetical protein
MNSGSNSIARPEQMEFPSLAFPEDRSVLYPFELSMKLRCTLQHVLDLIEEGKIAAVDISGKGNLTDRRTLRIPVESWERFVKENTV